VPNSIRAHGNPLVSSLLWDFQPEKGGVANTRIQQRIK